MTQHYATMDRQDAWTRLRSESYGRLALCVDNQPEIFPVNFLADESSILIRTRPGTKVNDISKNDRVAFEADNAGHTAAWSVVVKGVAHRIDDAAALRNVQDAVLWSWAPGAKDVFIRITPVEVTGVMFTRR